MNGIELYCSKKVYSCICRLSKNSWQEFQYANGTFGLRDSKEWEFDVKEIQDLLNEAKIDSAGNEGVT